MSLLNYLEETLEMDILKLHESVQEIYNELSDSDSSDDSEDSEISELLKHVNNYISSDTNNVKRLELEYILTILDRLYFFMLSDDEMDEINDMIDGDFINISKDALSELSELNVFNKSTEDITTEFKDIFNITEKHASQGQRASKKLARKGNQAVKRSLAIRAKKAKLCPGQFTTYNKKQHRCIYKSPLKGAKMSRLSKFKRKG